MVQGSPPGPAMQATVSLRKVPGGTQVVIEYEDGHTVRISAVDGLDSLVVRMHLGLLEGE